MTVTLLGRGSIAMLAVTGIVLAGCATSVELLNRKPTFIGEVSIKSYDGVTDDLLTAGLGKTGLGLATAPVLLDPAQPTPAELRKLAIYNNYRAVLDISPGGGYGTLYGPNIDATGHDTLGEGLVAGTEYIAYADDGTGLQNVTMLVQVPSTFNPANACIITGTSSGSRGVYGAIGSAGEWGLKRGCAVAYNDKGTGIGIHDLQNNTVNLQNGVRADAAAVGNEANFKATLSAEQLQAFNQTTPNRFAVKHAHSQQNPEKNWGRWTLQSVEFAYYVLNEKYAELGADGVTHLARLTPANTIVIASSISNGGGAALAAAELDTTGLISGVAVSEPNVQLATDNRLLVTRGSASLVGTGRLLYDYFTLANLLQPCAALAAEAAGAPLLSNIAPATAAARCATLQANGFVSGGNTALQASSALNLLQSMGYQPESNLLHASMYALATPAIVMTYANAYGRFSVADNLCGFSFSGTGDQLPTSFGRGNGIPPMVGINIFNNNSVGGAVPDSVSISPSSGVMDYNFDGALCQRKLAVVLTENALRVQNGMGEVTRSANLHGKPALIVHGRADTLIPVAFSSRPYFGVNRMVEGVESKLSYIEVTNAQHFDSFLPIAGFDARFVPLHHYFNQAMDLMYAHLKAGAALPVSQLVRTTPRGVDAAGKANPISLGNLPPIKMTVAEADAITFSRNVVRIPD